LRGSQNELSLEEKLGDAMWSEPFWSSKESEPFRKSEEKQQFRNLGGLHPVYNFRVLRHHFFHNLRLAFHYPE
jgi:hypothetical protein